MNKPPKITDHGAFKTYEGVLPSIQVNVLRLLPKNRYVAALQRLRTAISEGRPLEAFDDDTPGNKSMGCSWGLCDQGKRTWPDAQDHTFPLDFLQSGRISAIESEQLCPLDTRTKPGFNGCFYTCRVFQATRKRPAPTREEALQLYDTMIAKYTT